MITSRASHEAGLPHGVVYAASRGMLIDRVTALRHANIFEPHRYRHIVGPIRIEQVDATVAQAHRTLLPCASCMTARWGSLRPAAISTASTLTSQPYRFIERLVVLDSQKIDTLLVIPL